VFDPLWNSGKGREVLQDIDAKRRLINHTPDTVDEAKKEKGNAEKKEGDVGSKTT